jgi:hypothetical protein
MCNKYKLIAGFSLLFPALAFAEGQRGFDKFIWAIGLFFIIGLIVVVAIIGYFIINNIGSNKLNKKQKLTYWLTALLVTFIIGLTLNFVQKNNENDLEKENARWKAINDSIIKSIQHKDSLNKTVI